MKQPIKKTYKPNLIPKDSTRVLTGGTTESVGLKIDWQDGPLDPSRTMDDGRFKGENGAFLQTVLHAVIERLKDHQESPMAGRENAVALTHLETAQLWLGKREQDRQERGVLGTHEP